MNSPILPVVKQNFYPLSSAQKRMYIINQFDKASTNYNIYSCMPVSSDTSVKDIERIFKELIQRHEIFRTSFDVIDDLPIQRIANDVQFEVDEMDAAESDIHTVFANFVRPFDLAKAPLMRAAIATVRDQNRFLLLDFHHIIFDGVSSDIFLTEVKSLFAERPLLPLTIHYKDYAVWQQERLQSLQLQSQEQYWLAKMSGELPVLNLHTDYSRPTVLTFAGDETTFSIDESTHKRLKKLCADSHCTLFATMLASYYVLLHKYTLQEDIIVGTLVEGRFHPDLENMIGMFVNTLPFRNSPKPDKTFLAFLTEVKESLLAAYDNQDYPFEHLIDKLRLERQTSRNPLFDTLFTVSEGKYERSEIASLGAENGGTSKFDISLTALNAQDSLTLVINYSTNLFTKATIAKMAEHYAVILDSVSLNPSQRICDIVMIASEEHDLILNKFTTTSAVQSKNGTLHGWFDQQVALTPERIALQLENKTMTYQQLNDAANGLAHRLREQGVTKNSLVGLMATRSFDMIIGLIGILKSGGAYVPIDPTYPKERISFLLNDSKCLIIVTQSKLSHIISNATSKVICVDELEQIIFLPSTDLNTGCDLAYVIYTSGSTGTPKGVMIEHHSVINLIEYQLAMFGVDKEDRILQFSSLCFDASVEQIFLALLSGARLVLVDKDTLTDIKRFENYLADTAVTHLHAVPSFLQQLSSSTPATLKRVVSGGEECPLALARKWKSEVTFYNEYGPTETTVTCIESRSQPNQDMTSIGRPVANTHAYILTKNNGVCPIGVVGELCISGEGVARGYLFNDVLTKERFQPDPFLPFRRMYRTGDLAKWLPDGRIVFLGRIDDQVKIRGFRIEPGEIRARLLELDSIMDAAVVSKEHHGALHLCAYYVSSATVTVMEMKRRLLQVLPDYMVPAFFFRLEKLPLNANGKLDRKALPSIQSLLIEQGTYEIPANAIERSLASMWTEILGLKSPGRDDNFFGQGGNSLTAVVLTNRIQREFDIDATLKDVFTHQTLRELANFISGMPGVVDAIEKRNIIEVLI